MARPSRCKTPKKDRYRDWLSAHLATARIAHSHPSADAQEPYECAGHWHTRTVSKRKRNREEE